MSLAASPPSAASAACPTFSGLTRPYTASFGETVIIYEGSQRFTPLTLTPGGTLQNRFGVFHHSEIVGVRYGGKVRGGARSRGRRGAAGGAFYEYWRRGGVF